MKSFRERDRDDGIRHEAALWLARHDRGLEAAEQDQFFQWLAADPRHGEWFSRHRAGWNRLDAIADWRPEHSAEPNPDLLARPKLRVLRWRPIAWSALAASIALALGLWSQREPAPLAPLNPDGYERRLLEDGSVVELIHGAEIEVKFSAAERRVILREGEALFTVATNLQRPFVVSARGVDVRAVGTVFNVRLDAAAVEVLVTEGKVQVAPPLTARASTDRAVAPLPVVTAGDCALVPLVLNAVAEITRTPEVELARLRSWQPQLLEFSSTRLDQVVEEFNRRNRLQLVLADSVVAGMPIVASIRSDNIDGFVRLVSAAAHLRAEKRGEYEIVLRAVN